MKPESEWTAAQREAAEALRKYGSKFRAAEALGISPSSIDSRCRGMGARIADFTHRDCTKNRAHERAMNQAVTPVVPLADPLPDPDLSIDEIRAHRRRAFERKLAHHAAKRWRKFRIPVHGPYALMFFGDPHVDDDGCHQILLESHCELAASTEALYAVNIGDSTNNWQGRLARLWAEQDASTRTAQKMAQWLLGGSGVPWFLWLHGNHDLWGGACGPDWFGAVKPHFVEMEDWQAKVTLVSPNGYELRLWAAHNFKGNSIWNNLHGLERAAQMQDWAHLYVAGHHHDTGVRQGENPHRRFCYWLMRVRGYKFMDDHAEQHGFGEHQFGAAGVAIIDPVADKPNAVQCFLDPFEAVEFLKWKRRDL